MLKTVLVRTAEVAFMVSLFGFGWFLMVVTG